MITEPCVDDILGPEYDGPDDEAQGGLEFNRRGFLQLLGAGLLITTVEELAVGQAAGPKDTVAARLHVARDGTITVMTGKVEVGQGARAQLSQAAAEELRVHVDRIRLVMADTDLVPDDGITAGSRTTPRTVPAVRKAAAAARGLLKELACQRWKVKPDAAEVRDGAVIHGPTKRKITYAALAESAELAKALAKAIPPDVAVTPVAEWQVLGTSAPRPNRRDIVTGAHRFPSDIVRPDMLHGKVLRPPSYGATLSAIDPSAAKAMAGVTVVRDGEFVGCAAPTRFGAEQAVKALAEAASWKTAPHPSSTELFSHLKAHARTGGGRRSRTASKGSVADALAGASKVLRETYEVAYVQHAPMEPRAAVAEWNDGKLTVWTGSQAPNRVHSQLARAFGIPAERVRVIIPDTGGGFGGKHTGEAAEEAARLARGAGRPVALRWSRAEEFTWAYFRPAGVIEAHAGLDADGSLVAWDFANINSGGSAIASPYEIPNTRTRSLPSDAPLRQGSYRCLAATANNFARESFMDELAAAAGTDPLAFRLAHLKDARLRAVLEAAAKEFRWDRRRQRGEAGVGVGLACGTEKGSYVAACAEVAVDRKRGRIDVRRVCEVFECGAVQNPANLRSQVAGCIIMGMGAALTEEMKFENGKVLNARFSQYQVPRFKDVPELDVQLLDRPDLPSVGGGETPIIAIAPAIANAVFNATGVRIRTMPIRGAALQET